MSLEPIAQKKLPAKKPANAVNTAVTEENISRRASELGEKIRVEDGTGCIVQFIKQRTGP